MTSLMFRYNYLNGIINISAFLRFIALHNELLYIEWTKAASDDSILPSIMGILAWPGWFTCPGYHRQF